MKNDLLFSIIVPMYNCEKTIDKAIKSILLQTYSNFELLLIDDGSKDSTISKVSKYSEDSRIIIIKKNNEGVSATRNKGLEIATGDYIMFLDADDYYSNNLLSELYAILNNTDLDLVKFSYWKETNKGLLKSKYNFTTITGKKINKNEFDKLVIPNILTSYDYNPIWNCAIKRKCLENIKFDISFITAEDLDFFTNVLCYVDNIFILDVPLIHYVYNMYSITRSSNIDKSLKKFYSQISCYCKIKNRFNSIIDEKVFIKRIYFDFCTLIYDFINNSKSYDNYINMLLNTNILELYREYINKINIELKIDFKENIIFSKKNYKRNKIKNKITTIKKILLNLI